MATSALCSKESEVTPEMIEAGARIIEDRFDLPCGGWEAKDLARDIFDTMLDARSETHSDIPTTDRAVP